MYANNLALAVKLVVERHGFKPGLYPNLMTSDTGHGVGRSVAIGLMSAEVTRTDDELTRR